MTTGEKAGKKGLWGYLRIVLVTLFRLPLILVVLVVALFGGNHHLVQYRANTFCDSFTIGAPFDLVKFEAQAGQVPSTRVHTGFFSEGNGFVLVQFREILPEYYSCSLGIVNGTIATKEVQFKD
jgi:hypothetical protein